VVLDTLCRNTPVFLALDPPDEDVYVWLYNRFGAPFRPATLENINQKAIAAFSFLDGFASALAGTPLSLSVDEVTGRVAPFETALRGFEQVFAVLGPPKDTA
jgi:hypothetical protein